MEENKAAAYYDEVLRKGGGAARFKQGLGYDAQSSDTVAASSSFPSSHMFVKGASRDDNLAAIEKEIRLANVRDKLKKHDVDVRQGMEDKELRRLTKKSRSISPERGSESLEHRRRGSHVSSGHPAKTYHSFRHHDRDGVDRSLMRERKRRHKKQDSASGSGSSSSGEHGKISHSSSGDGHNRGSRRKGRRQRRSDSRSSSEKGRSRSRMKRSHSHAHSHAHSDQSGSSSADSRGERKQTTKRERRRTHHSSRRVRLSARRSKSLSSSGYSSEDQCRSHRKRHLGSHRSSNRIQKCQSPCMQRKERSNFGEDQKDLRIGRNRPGGKTSTTHDYSKIIPGFDSMSPAEKVKAKMKVQLSETVVKDSSKGMSGEWERFDFNKEAPLDDDAKLDYFGDGTETRDDTAFLQNAGSTFMSSNHQARREAQVQEAHDAAIFGLSIGSISAGKEIDSRKGQHRSVSVEESVKDTNGRVQLEQNPPKNNLLSGQVMARQQVSWRERALQVKE